MAKKATSKGKTKSAKSEAAKAAKSAQPRQAGGGAAAQQRPAGAAQQAPQAARQGQAAQQKQQQQQQQAAAGKFRIGASKEFLPWLQEQEIGLSFTTYQTGKIFFIGLGPQGKRLSIFNRSFRRAMGLWTDEQNLLLGTETQIWKFHNALGEGEDQNGFDRMYVPRIGYTVGDVDIHDVAIDKDGRMLFVSTLFGCLATVSEEASFTPLWKPPFLSKLAAEDRCHLNGLAVRDGEARYVTCIGKSDAAEGWRDHRAGGGVTIDVKSDDYVCEGLAMPHSPRWHDGKLYVAESGSGYFGYVDLKTGKFEQIAFCPGYIRGVAFNGKYAIVGLSKARRERTFQGLPLQKNLDDRKITGRCGLAVIDLETGKIPHWLRIEGSVEELYDVAVLPGARRPMALGFQTDEIARFVRSNDSDIGRAERAI